MVDKNSHHPCQYQASRPTGVQDVQPFGFFLAEHGGDHRVNERFNRAVAQSQYQTTPIEELKTCLLIARMGNEKSAHRHYGPDHMTEERDDHGHLVTNFVDD